MNLLESCPRALSLEELLRADQAMLASFRESGWQFDYFYHPAGKSTLLVFLPSALPAGKRLVPAFHRWSWAPRLAGGFDVICVSDPTLHLDERIHGGWLQGTKDDWLPPRILSHLAALARRCQYRQIVFCGSSLGGFAALQVATLAQAEGLLPVPVLAYAENPQISLFKYAIPKPMALLAQVCYGVPSLEDVGDALRERLDVGALMVNKGLVPAGLVVTKESDAHHHGVQLQHLRDSIAAFPAHSLEIEVIPAAADSSGHTPLTLEEMRTRVAALLRRHS